MKKTYISPVALTVSLVSSMPLALSGYNDIGSGEQLVKGFVDDFDDNDNGNVTGGKSIWDNEW